MNEKEYLENVKNNLSIEQMSDILNELGGDPQPAAAGIIKSKTICHCGNSHKLYYYNNTHLFKCYTDCGGDAWDIFELVQKVKNAEGYEWNLPKAIKYVIDYFNITPFKNSNKNTEELPDWKILNKYDIIKEENDEKHIIELKYFNDNILQFLPRPNLLDWEQEGIKKEIINAFNICYNPVTQAIVIPHYDDENNLIGIRERTLVKENEINGKYKPSIINGTMYNHPLGFSLYGLNMSKNNIKTIGKVIVGEGEKFCLGYASYFGLENNISVACCGSSLISHQIDLLLKYNVKEIIIAWDRQFKEVGDNEWKIWTKKLTDINTKYGAKVQISYMFDKNNDLGYKMSPIDGGPEIFMKMFNERISI